MSVLLRRQRRAGVTVLLLLAAALLYHLITLGISPVVWTDEVFFNAVTMDWLRHGTFRYTADWNWVGSKEVVAYGPVFFWLNALVLGLLGNGLFQARLLSMLAGFGLVVGVSVVLRQQAGRFTLWWIAGVALLLLDPFFNAGLHNGRMDTLATLLFAGAGMVVVRRFEKPLQRLRYDLRWWVLSGFLFAASVLTTPRMLMLAPALAVLIIWHAAKHRFSGRALCCVGAWGLVAMSVYAAWFFYAFGNVDSFLSYYEAVQRNQQLHALGFYVPRELYPLVAVTLIATTTGALVLGRSFFTPVVVFCLGVILSFFTLVSDTGPYSVILVPFYYVLLVDTLLRLHFQPVLKRLGAALLVALFGFNLSVFGIKAAVLVAEKPNRDYRKVDAFVRHNIPPGARVAADEVYYYALVENGYPFHMLISYQFEFEPTAHYTLHRFDYDYIVLAERMKMFSPRLYNLYLNQALLEPVDTLQNERSPLLQFLSARGLYGYGGYDGIIYKRIRE